jgi:hypothetical protein
MAITLHLSGGASNANVLASIGGAISTVTVPSLLFSPITAAQFTAGRIMYRCLYVKVDVATDAVKPWIAAETPSASTTIAIGWGAAINATQTAIANETTAPAGVSFASPASEGAATSGGNFTAGQFRALWLRFTITAGATPVASEQFQLVINGQSTSIGIPVNTTAPSITGAGTVGSTLTRAIGTWTGSPTLAGQWLRHGVETISGATASTYTVVSADSPPTRLAYLDYDLYDGGPCPIPGTQTAVRWIDPTNGNDANNGLTRDTPWRTPAGRTLTNTVVNIKLPPSGFVHDVTGQFPRPQSWLTGATLNNVTFRAEGEDVIEIRNEVDVDGNQDGALVYLTSSGGAANDVTFYKLRSYGWGAGMYLADAINRIRVLRCEFWNPTLDVPGSGQTSTGQTHGIYLSRDVAGAGPAQIEIAYCRAVNTRAFRQGSFIQCFGDGAGVQSLAVHHNVIPGGTSLYQWAVIHDRETTANADYFCNTFDANFSSAVFEFASYSTGTGVNSSTRVRSNILSNSNSNRRIIWKTTAHTPDLGANNTCYSSAGAVTFIDTTLAAVGQERNPQLDANGVAANAAEQGSGSLRTALGSWVGHNGNMPSSTTNVDRGAYQYGTASAQQGKIVYRETATNVSGSAVAFSNALTVT